MRLLNLELYRGILFALIHFAGILSIDIHSDIHIKSITLFFDKFMEKYEQIIFCKDFYLPKINEKINLIFKNHVSSLKPLHLAK